MSTAVSTPFARSRLVRQRLSCLAVSDCGTCFFDKDGLAEIDAAHIAEELEDMGKRERRALESHIRNVTLHFAQVALSVRQAHALLAPSPFGMDALRFRPC